MPKLIGAIIDVVAAVLIGILATLVLGFVLASYWSWFIVPVFHIASLTTQAAIGIAFTFQLLQFSQHTHLVWLIEADPNTKGVGKASLYHLMRLLSFAAAWVVGWAWHALYIH